MLAGRGRSRRQLGLGLWRHCLRDATAASTGAATAAHDAAPATAVAVTAAAECGPDAADIDIAAVARSGRAGISRIVEFRGGGAALQLQRRPGPFLDGFPLLGRLRGLPQRQLPHLREAGRPDPGGVARHVRPRRFSSAVVSERHLQSPAIGGAPPLAAPVCFARRRSAARRIRGPGTAASANASVASAAWRPVRRRGSGRSEVQRLRRSAVH